MTQLQRWS